MSNKNKFLVAQLGARRDYAIARMLNDSGMLGKFYTDLYSNNIWFKSLNILPKIIQPNGLKRLLARKSKHIPDEKITAFNNLGIEYYLAQKKSLDNDQMAGIYIKFGKLFCELILKAGFGDNNATYTFNSAGLELMIGAKNAGLTTVMEQTSSPCLLEMEILAEAVDRYPEWAVKVPFGKNIRGFIEREEAEWGYADHILCGSQYVIDGIVKRGGPVEKCILLPYGVDSRFEIQRDIRQPGPLRVLTVGHVRLQKGVPIVWESAILVGSKAEFRMVGAIDVPPLLLGKKPGNVELTGAVTRSEVIDHYRWADIFLLPSLSEGSAAVTYEAMRAGLPVICTPNTGSIVIDKITGIIVPIFSAEAISLALKEIISDISLLDKYRFEIKKIESDLGLDSYEYRLQKALSGIN